jgi:hypothetical protein
MLVKEVPAILNWIARASFFVRVAWIALKCEGLRKSGRFGIITGV